MPGRYPDPVRALPLFDARFDAHELRASGCRVLFASYPAGTRIAPHRHDTDNHGVVTRGELVLTIADSTTRHGPGQWYHVPAGAEHAAAFERDTDEIEFWFEANGVGPLVPARLGDAPDAPLLRRASRADLAAIIALLADDPLGAARETPSDPPLPAYQAAFAAIDADPNTELVVACDGDAVVGTLQVSYIPCLAYRGGWRALIESVRVAAAMRGRRLGRAMLVWAIARARSRGCRLVQLTTDRKRADARRFYESLGFVASHEGMKLHLPAG